MIYDEDDDVLSYGAQFNTQLVPPDQQTVIMEGMLKKKSPKGILKPWQYRWSKLTNQGFYYYDKKNSNVEKGLVPIYAIATISCDTSTFRRKGYRFNILLSEKYGGRVFSFVAETEAECFDWVEKLRKVHTEYHDNINHYNEPADEGANGGGKIWKNRKNKEAGSSSSSSRRDADTTSFGSSMMPYRLFNPPSRVAMFDTPQSICQTLFGDFKVESEECTNDFGTIYIVGDTHYPMTHRSFLLHSIEHGSLYRDITAAAMDQLATYDHPSFARHIHKGVTSDTVYSIYHPPLRPNVDSTFAWLETYQRLPEDVVRYMAVQLVLALEYVHSRGHLFLSLSPETIFFDREGNIRIFDVILPIAPQNVPILLPEYIPPEVAHHGRTKCSVKADSWRLGVFLYEIVTGFPPFRPTTTDESGTPYDEEIVEQIKHFHVSSLQFPPNTSAEMIDLVKRLLDTNAETRLCGLDAFKSHGFFRNVPSWDINTVLAQEKPQWVLEHITGRLDSSDDTPVNLTLVPEPTLVQRVGVSVLSIKGINKDPSQRLFCNISVEGDLRKTRVLSADQPDWNETFVFDILNGNFLPDYSDLVIEIHSKKREADGKHSMVGVVAFALNEIKRLGQIDTFMTVQGLDGLPVGELHVKLGWVEDPIQITTNILQPLSDMSRSFAETFGKPVAAPPNKLWSLIIDPVVNSTQSHIAEAIAEQVAASAAAANLNTPQSPKLASPTLVSNNSQFHSMRRSTNMMTPMVNAESPHPSTAPPSFRLSSTGLASPSRLENYSLSTSPSGFIPSASNAFGGHSPKSGTAPPVSPMHAAVSPMARSMPPPRLPPAFNVSPPVPAPVPARPAPATPVAPPTPTVSFTNSNPGSAPAPTPPMRLPRPSVLPPVPPPLPATLASPSAHAPPPLPAAYANASLPHPPTNVPPPLPQNAPPVAKDNAFSAGAATFDSPENVRNKWAAMESEREKEREMAKQKEREREAAREALQQQQQQQQALSPEETPSNWRTAVDASSGDTYYYNKVTKTVTWFAPECILNLQRAKQAEQASK